MSTIVTRAAKGSPLTHTEVDANFTNLNTDKIESGNTVAALTIQSATITGGTVNNTSIGGSTPAAGTFTTLTATGQTSLGGAAGSESLRVITPTGGGGNYWQLEGSNGDVAARFLGSSSNIGATFVTRGSGNYNFATGTSTSTVQARISHTASAVNYVQVTGAATTKNVIQSAQGSDTNIGYAIQPKGTGAINLAPGSSGVNISNGGTVTAITRTATGSLYTSIPSVAISAPTTAGGVQATATCTMFVSAVSLVFGGTGYTLNDTLTISGGTFASAATLTVTSVSSGVITGVSIANGGSNYSVLPTNPVSVTGGTGSGATFNITSWSVSLGFTITNAGSGYVEQPTVTFSGGGGSGAAAYAQVGSVTTIKSLGALSERSLAFQGPNNFDVLQLDGSLSNSTAETIRIQATPFGRANLISVGGANSQLWLGANGTGYVNFSTRGTSLVTQFRVADTASAVNYVQVTGSVTNQTAANLPSISVQGSDTNTFLGIGVKTTSGYVAFYAANNTGNQVFRVNGTNAANTANRVEVTAAASGSGPTISVQGGTSTADANIDLNLTTKGTGAVRFNTGGGEQARVLNVASANRYVEIQGGVSGSSAPGIGVGGGGEALDIYSSSNAIRFYTSGKAVASQFFVAHTASAVNYVQVTGAATGNPPTISMQGSDSNVGVNFTTKGTGSLRFNTGGGLAVLVNDSGGTTANYLQMQGRQAGNGPIISVEGSDTNIDINFTPKGTGRVRFGTHTATADTAISGYIEIKDSGGTTRRLAVIT